MTRFGTKKTASQRVSSATAGAKTKDMKRSANLDCWSTRRTDMIERSASIAKRGGGKTTPMAERAMAERRCRRTRDARERLTCAVRINGFASVDSGWGDGGTGEAVARMGMTARRR